MEKQHYVPKSYLKQFCLLEDETLFGTRFINSINKSCTEKYNINSICYDVDFYNLNEIQTSFHSVSEDIIERKAFWYERTFISEIVKKAQSKTLNESLIGDLAFFMLSMKARNPKFREGYKQHNIDKHLPSVITEIYQKFKLIQKDVLDNAVDIAVKNLKENPLKHKNLHTNSLLYTHAGSNKVFNSIFQRLKNYYLEVYSIEDNEESFIISDAPGYSVDQTKTIHNTKYVDDLYHFIPISFSLALGFINPRFSKNIDRITYLTINSSELFQFNYGTALIRTKDLYSGNPNTIIEFTNRVFQKK